MAPYLEPSGGCDDTISFQNAKLFFLIWPSLFVSSVSNYGSKWGEKKNCLIYLRCYKTKSNFLGSLRLFKLYQQVKLHKNDMSFDYFCKDKHETYREKARAGIFFYIIFRSIDITMLRVLRSESKFTEEFLFPIKSLPCESSVKGLVHVT